MSGTDQTFTTEDIRQAYLALAEDFMHRAETVRRARQALSTDSIHQREKMRGKEQAWLDAARITRMAAPKPAPMDPRVAAIIDDPRAYFEGVRDDMSNR